MQVDPPPEEAPIFERPAELAALAVETRRRLGTSSPRPRTGTPD
jgi:hypothetical protein